MIKKAAAALSALFIAAAGTAPAVAHERPAQHFNHVAPRYENHHFEAPRHYYGGRGGFDVYVGPPVYVDPVPVIPYVDPLLPPPVYDVAPTYVPPTYVPPVYAPPLIEVMPYHHHHRHWR